MYHAATCAVTSVHRRACACTLRTHGVAGVARWRLGVPAGLASRRYAMVVRVLRTPLPHAASAHQLSIALGGGRNPVGVRAADDGDGAAGRDRHVRAGHREQLRRHGSGRGDSGRARAGRVAGIAGRHPCAVGRRGAQAGTGGARGGHRPRRAGGVGRRRSRTVRPRRHRRHRGAWAQPLPEGEYVRSSKPPLPESDGNSLDTLRSISRDTHAAHTPRRAARAKP